jgi:hypothetical protein
VLFLNGNNVDHQAVGAKIINLAFANADMKIAA